MRSRILPVCRGLSRPGRPSVPVRPHTPLTAPAASLSSRHLSDRSRLRRAGRTLHAVFGVPARESAACQVLFMEMQFWIEQAEAEMRETR